MRYKTTALLVAATMTLSACGAASAGNGDSPADDADEPLIQITSEGGFAPVEMILGNGPRFTLLADGSMIYRGPFPEIFPGPLVPDYRVTTLTDEDMDRVLAFVDEIGLPDFEERLDDTQASMVADATTEVITYWDENGEHTYGVYALGIEPNPSNPATAAFAELLDFFGQLSLAEGEPYEPEQVRVIAGPGVVHEEFEDIQDWPLDDSDLSDWEMLPNGWQCEVLDPEILDVFSDATQVTVWSNPDPDLPNSYLKLLARPLLPGEPDCPQS